MGMPTKPATAGLLTLVAFVSVAAPAGAQTTGPLATEPASLEALAQCPPSLVDAPSSQPQGAPPKGPCLDPTSNKGFGLGAAIAQTLVFTAFQHLSRLRDSETRNELGGPFIEDWFKSVSHLGRDWDDGNRTFTNYIGHPIGGAVYAHIYRQNDARRIYLEVGEPGYGGMVLRALAFSAAASLQFELGPLSEASIGNVGMRNPQKMAWVDLVITPVLGTAWMVGEDLVDQKVLARMDTQNVYLKNIVRSFLNPSRSGSNLVRGHLPWYRDRDFEAYRRARAGK